MMPQLWACVPNISHGLLLVSGPVLSYRSFLIRLHVDKNHMAWSQHHCMCKTSILDL